MITPMAQLLVQSSFTKDWLSFKYKAHNLQSAQKAVLENILRRHPYIKSNLEFDQAPLRSYAQQCEKLKNCSRIAKRYQPTSGSGDKEKLIPYTPTFIRELNRGLNPWLFDIAKQFPSILSGKHYWSLSWLPTHYREKNWQLDDFELLPHWKKELTKILMAVPNDVSKAKTLEASQFATLAYLIAAKDLTFLSVWSPTFLLQLISLLAKWDKELKATLTSGTWSLYQDELKFLRAPKTPDQAEKLSNLRDLWPKLTLISSWDSSTSKSWAQKLQSYFPGVHFQGKGLWATEGVITIPFEGEFVLSYLSHYYEFINLKSGELIPSWKLKEGMEVHPVITCGNGFTRYNLKDKMIVTGHYQEVPTLEFLERDQTFDMVGEKMDAHCFLEIHNEMKKIYPDLIWVDALAINSSSARPYYHFIFEGKGIKDEIYKDLDHLLNQRFHYHLAQELGQLAPVRLFLSTDAFKRYEEFQIKKGMAQGNIKVELATFIQTPTDEKLYHEYFPH